MAFCFMQKFVDLDCLGNKLQIVSAFALDHVKGFVFVEADKANDVSEVCFSIFHLLVVVNLAEWKVAIVLSN